MDKTLMQTSKLKARAKVAVCDVQYDS